MASSLIHELKELVPSNLIIKTTDSIDGMFNAMGREAMNGVAHTFFGTAMIQGNRVQFVTAMPLPTMLGLARVDRSHKKDTVDVVTGHSNRPEEPQHQKKIRDYLLETACERQKFILPAFTLNFGLARQDGTETKDVVLTMFDAGGARKNVWPAMLSMPKDTKLDITDGAHRDKACEGVSSDKKLAQEMREALLDNAVDVKIVFESDPAASYQDFADCGKAKAIAGSLIVTFDTREAKNKRTKELVENVPFLLKHVDATAKNVNLSGRSRKVWTMNAIKMFITHIVDSDFNPDQEQPKVADNKIEQHRKNYVWQRSEG